MRAADLRMDDLLEMDPAGGLIRFGGNRTLLFDAVALGLLRKQLVETFGVDTARGLLTRFGYSHGYRMAESLRDTLPWESEREWRIAGGRLHRLQGLVRFEPASEERPGVVAEAVWHDSYEAEQHVLHLGQADRSVCWSLCGFASGYLSRVTQQAVYAREVSCCGAGDAVCHMVARTEQGWGDEIESERHYYERDCLDASLKSLRDEVRRLERKLSQRRRALGADADALERGGVVARSEAMRRVLQLSQRVAAVDSTVMIRGESGVGKERIARFIHDQSSRTAGPFVAVNCGALPSQLLESELFGHRRGAFSGAINDRPGLFEAAHGGTLLLDEIGDVPMPLQVRLLRVLQEREVRRVGENHPRAVDVRVLAATHRDLAAEVSAGRFRQDLLYRLQVVEITVLPLRDRRDDILPLARLKLVETSHRYERNVRDLTPAAARRLLEHDWPGNVRELQNVIERAVVFAEGDCVDVADLQLTPQPEPHVRNREQDAAPDSHIGLEQSLPLADVERRHILAVLAAAGGNRAEAARRLNIGVATLFRKLKLYGRQGGSSL